MLRATAQVKKSLIWYDVAKKKLDFKTELLQRNIRNHLMSFYSLDYPIPITLRGRLGITGDIAKIPFNLVLPSAALVELAKSTPVHFFLPFSTSSAVYFFFFALCPAESSVLSQKTLGYGLNT